MSGPSFWTVSRHLVNVLEPDGAGQWFGRYAWWNIYPLGWDEPDSGPTGALKDAQTPLVGELFWAAMDEVGAERIVLVAGRSMWWEIRGLLGLESLAAGRAPLIASGIVQGRRIVAAYHPRGARQLGISDKDQVAAIAAAMTGL